MANELMKRDWSFAKFVSKCEKRIVKEKNVTCKSTGEKCTKASCKDFCKSSIN